MKVVGDHEAQVEVARGSGRCSHVWVQVVISRKRCSQGKFLVGVQEELETANASGPLRFRSSVGQNLRPRAAKESGISELSEE